MHQVIDTFKRKAYNYAKVFVHLQLQFYCDANLILCSLF